MQNGSGFAKVQRGENRLCWCVVCVPMPMPMLACFMQGQEGSLLAGSWAFTLLLSGVAGSASRLVTAAGEGMAATAAVDHDALRAGRSALGCVSHGCCDRHDGDPSVSSWGPIGLAWAADLLSRLDGAVHLIRLRPVNGGRHLLWRGWLAVAVAAGVSSLVLHGEEETP